MQFNLIGDDSYYLLYNSIESANDNNIENTDSINEDNQTNSLFLDKYDINSNYTNYTIEISSLPTEKHTIEISSLPIEEYKWKVGRLVDFIKNSTDFNFKHALYLIEKRIQVIKTDEENQQTENEDEFDYLDLKTIALTLVGITAYTFKSTEETSDFNLNSSAKDFDDLLEKNLEFNHFVNYYDFKRLNPQHEYKIIKLFEEQQDLMSQVDELNYLSYNEQNSVSKQEALDQIYSQHTFKQLNPQEEQTIVKLFEEQQNLKSPLEVLDQVYSKLDQLNLSRFINNKKM